LIEDGHDVVLHCIKGKDRTGKVAYMVLREYGYSHEDAIQTMGHIRPVCEEFWTTKNFEEYLL
jgi:protein-tyrosine phosphatase